MERIASTEERIRRAEEIYNRRRCQGIRVSSGTVNNNARTKLSLFKKMITKIIICIIIYFVFFIIKNSSYIFSEQFIKSTKDILSYDIDFQSAYSQIITYFNKLEFKGLTNQDSEKEDVPVVDEVTETSEIQNEELGVGGAEGEDSISKDTALDTNIETKTQMERDAEYIKQIYSFIKPAQGTVTSRFGSREATDIISANHEGIDIGAKTGTAIYAAIGGTVVEASSTGDYGKHIKIANGDVITLYAHCRILNVKMGESITQGQKIAEIGSTGRATGPHLHFEIARDGRVVNPEYVLDF